MYLENIETPVYPYFMNERLVSKETEALPYS